VYDIENLSSGTVTSVKESEREARVRQLNGFTLACSIVMRKAIASRVEELNNEMLACCTSPLRVSHIKYMLKRLQPGNHSTEGILFFGLRHTIVQQHHKRIPAENGDDGTGYQNDTAGKECADGVPRQYESATGGAEQTRGKNPEGSGGDCISQTPKT
jgi:hypothetical protein